MSKQMSRYHCDSKEFKLVSKFLGEIRYPGIFIYFLRDKKVYESFNKRSMETVEEFLIVGSQILKEDML